MNATDLDLSLVRRAQSGERRAFDLLVRKYQDRINRLARRYMGNPADAQDVTQDIFIKAYRGLQLFRCESAFYTWLYRLAINAAKNALLARACEPVGRPLDSSSEDEFSDVWVTVTDMTTAEDTIIADEIESTLKTAIEALSDKLKTAILLREIEGLPYHEIAVRMECPVGTIRSHIFRAREVIDHRLRQVFADGLGRRRRLLSPAPRSRDFRNLTEDQHGGTRA
jgi:RNA polymerase sigma-70 factor (ECF subfamily)